MDIEKKVLLLGILKRKEEESLNDILFTLEQSKVFSLKEGKKLLKELKNEAFIINNELSLKGVSKAKEVELEFKI